MKIDSIWFPSLSPDGRYRFFCGGFPTSQGYTESSYYSNYYGVDAGIVESLRPEEIE